MLDRASTFAQPEIVELLKQHFVPVAIDQAYQRRQQDSEGEFYREIASQGPRNDFRTTTQGFYIATPSGKLLLFNNNRDPPKVLRLMKQKLRSYQLQRARSAAVEKIAAEDGDPRFKVAPPEGGLVLRVHAKVMGGYEPTTDRWRRIFQNAVSRDNLWVTQAEHRSLVKGQLPERLQQRIARFHLVDNTRGEPPMWKPRDIRALNISLQDGEMRGTVQLESARGDRGYHAELRGELVVQAGQVVRWDFVCLGEFWGEGRFTGGAPQGKFPLAISFRLADGTDIADRVPPQGSRGWLEGYLR